MPRRACCVLEGTTPARRNSNSMPVARVRAQSCDRPLLVKRFMCLMSRHLTPKFAQCGFFGGSSPVSAAVSYKKQFPRVPILRRTYGQGTRKRQVSKSDSHSE